MGKPCLTAPTQMSAPTTTPARGGAISVAPAAPRLPLLRAAALALRKWQSSVQAERAPVPWKPRGEGPWVTAWGPERFLESVVTVCLRTAQPPTRRSPQSPVQVNWS